MVAMLMVECNGVVSQGHSEAGQCQVERPSQEMGLGEIGLGYQRLVGWTCVLGKKRRMKTSDGKERGRKESLNDRGAGFYRTTRGRTCSQGGKIASEHITRLS